MNVPRGVGPGGADQGGERAVGRQLAADDQWCRVGVVLVRLAVGLVVRASLQGLELCSL